MSFQLHDLKVIKLHFLVRIQDLNLCSIIVLVYTEEVIFKRIDTFRFFDIAGLVVLFLLLKLRFKFAIDFGILLLALLLLLLIRLFALQERDRSIVIVVVVSCVGDVVTVSPKDFILFDLLIFGIACLDLFVQSLARQKRPRGETTTSIESCKEAILLSPD